MSWRDQSPREFDPHGGRNAFRNDDTLQSTSERVASFRAMRSFTESIECDLPPAPELPAQLDIDRISMRTSDTNETIVEVVKSKDAIDPSLGETQKYKMSVPGPGHSEQEQELHKSLLRDDEELDSELEGIVAAEPTFKRPNPPSAFARHIQDPEHAALRRQYSNPSAQRPRPTTPTQSCALERFAFNAPSDEVLEVKEEQKIKVSIPSKERTASRRRKSDMPYSDFYESMSSQLPPQSRGTVSGRTTPLNDYEGDILEENPQYKNKAPPPPVVHRRTSIEWENFEEAKSAPGMANNVETTKVPSMEESTAKKAKVEETPATMLSTQASEEDEPMFSEEMLEERRKAQALRAAIKKEAKAEQIQPENGHHVEIEQESELETGFSEGTNKPAEAAAESATNPGAESEHTVSVLSVTTEPADADKVGEMPSAGSLAAVTVISTVDQNCELKEAATPETQTQDENKAAENATALHGQAVLREQAEVSEVENRELAYDPNAYPGYIWNYETQQWEVDPNYDPALAADYHAGYDQESYQYSYGATDVPQEFPRAPDINETEPVPKRDTTQNGGYSYAASYDPSYSQTYAYDQSDGYTGSTYQQAAASTYDQNAQPYYGQSAGYDQQASFAQGYEQQSGYDQQANYQYDQAQYPGYDQTATGYDQSASGYDQNGSAYGQQQYYNSSSSTVQGSGYVDGTYYQAHAGYDQTAADYSEPHIGYDQSYSSTSQTTDYSTTPQTVESAEQQQQPTTGEYSYSQYTQSYTTGYPGYQQGQEEQTHVYQTALYTETNAAAHQSHSYTTAENRYPPPPPQRPPPASAYPQSLFQSAPPSDPFAWESTAHDAAAPGTLSQSAVDHSEHSPSRPPPPSRPAPPKHPRTGAGDEQVAAALAAAQAGSHSPTPPRPPPAHPATPDHSTPPRPGPPSPRPPPPKKIEPVEPEPEEDAWTRFKKMTEQVNDALKSTEDTLKNLSETTAIKEIKDESYLGQIGGTQGYDDNYTQREIHRLEEQRREEKKLKKKMKQQGKKVPSPTFDPDREDSMDRAAQELAMKMASMRTDLGDWKPPTESDKDKETKGADTDSLSGIPPHKRSSLKDVQQDSGGSLELPPHLSSQPVDNVSPVGDLAPGDPKLTAPAWADFEAAAPELPPSESGFFSKDGNANDLSADTFDPFVVPSQFKPQRDPFAPPDKDLIEEDYDPFAVRPVEDIVAAARAKAEEVRMAKEAQEDVDFFSGSRHSPALSTPTPEGGSPGISPTHRPDGFEDEFKCEGMDMETPTPLYDEDDSEPLTEFLPKFKGDGWDLMVRHPIKKKSFMAERFWKPCYVRLQGNNLLVYNAKTDNRPIQELLLQASYSLSDTTLQAYDVYGKIHTVKLQYVQYKEKVGIRPGQISRLVDGHITKYGLPLEHTAQCTVLLKFGSLTSSELQSFVSTIEDVLFKCPAKRDTKPVYKQDEVQIHCYDEYSAYVDKEGILSDQKARVRLFCLAFVSGSPFLEIGLNDRRRQGKEIVRRKDILPMYTERWIRFEEVEFHSTVDQAAFEKEQVIRLSPPDGCFFEVMRFRIRPPRSREKALSVTAVMKIAGSKVEIRIEAMAAAQTERARGERNARRQIPCEDIAIRFPIPEAWIYIFREERHWGVGSVHSKKLRPGKVKNLKDRLLGAVQSAEANLIECAVGEAKYEHVYRALVWRIPRLNEKLNAAYKSHLLRCRFELSSFDLMPDAFLPRCEVDFTMPLATVSNTVVRSVSVEQHEDSDRVEKFVRYVAKCQYKVEIDYVQCADLEVDTMDPTTNPEVAMTTVPELHQPAFQPSEVSELHEGYRIEFNKSETGAGQQNDSSSDDDDDRGHKMPIIQIDMKNYGY